MKTDEDLLGYDFQGWPIYKMSLREILEILPFVTYNSNNGTYEIHSDDPILDVYPITLEDDGMGYGVNEHYITDVSESNDRKSLQIFIDKREPNE